MDLHPALDHRNCTVPPDPAYATLLHGRECNRISVDGLPVQAMLSGKPDALVERP
jgi:hypothetical protein